MADQVNDLSGKVSLDTTDYKTAVIEMNRQIRVIESGFRASAAALGDWGSTASGLEMRIKTLNQLMDVQQKKVSAVEAEYKRVAAEKGDTSRAAQDLQIKLNKETETLNKMQAELKQSETALDGMGDESKQASNQVGQLAAKEEKATSATSKLKTVVAGLKTGLKIGITALAALATAVVGVGAGITKLVTNTAQQADELQQLSDETGLTTSRLQELAYVSDQVGTSTETITGSMAKLIRSMSDAKEQAADYSEKVNEAGGSTEGIELGSAAEAFKTLGVQVTDAGGALRSNEAVFSDALAALGRMTNEAERDALAMEIFGKSAQELNPLIKAGTAEISRLSQEAYTVGAVMSDRTVTAMAQFSDELASLKAGLKGVSGTIGAAFLPGFFKITDKAKGYLSELSSIVNRSNGDLGTMASGIGSLIGQIANDLMSSGPEMLQGGLSVLQGIGTAITQNLPQLIPTVVTMIRSLVTFLIANLPALMQAGVQIILALVNGIVPELPKLVEAALQMIVTLANGIAEALPQLIPAIVAIIPQIIEVLVENLPLIIDAALQIIIALAEGFNNAMPALIEAVPKIIQAIFDALITALPLIGQAAVKLIDTLITGIAGTLPSVGKAAGQLVTVFVKGITSLASTLVKVGSSIVTGVWSGIASKADWFGSQVTAFFTNIVNGAKAALGIQSPSTVFAGIGQNMAAGLGVGFSRAFSAVKKDISGSVNGLQSMTGGVSAGGSSKSMSIGTISINVSAPGSTIDQTSLLTTVENAIDKAFQQVFAV